MDLEIAEAYVDLELANCEAMSTGDPQGMWRIRVPSLLAMKRVCMATRNSLPLGVAMHPDFRLTYVPKPIPERLLSR